MGWANWYAFACNYTEDTIKQQSKLIVDLGLKNLGYKYMIVQECIGINRTSEGVMIVDPTRFPSGMPNLTQYIHSLGLKAGIYTDVGPLTCAKYVGSYGYENIDAKTFIIDWKFDFIEEDSCYSTDDTNDTIHQQYTKMHNAIQATGSNQAVFYITCQGKDNVEVWGQSLGHIQRTTTDIMPGGAGKAYFSTVVGHFHRVNEFAMGNGPNHWNGADS